MNDIHPNVGDDPSMELSINASGVRRTVVHAISREWKGPNPTARIVSNIGKKGFEPSLRLETAQTPLTPSDIMNIQVNAQAVLSWMLNIPIKSGDSFLVGVGFSLDLDSHQETNHTIGSLLSHWSGIPQKNFGAPLRNIVIFIPPDEILKDKYTNGTPQSEPTWEEILISFPTIKTLIEYFRSRCRCYYCRDNQDKVTTSLNILKQAPWESFLHF